MAVVQSRDFKIIIRFFDKMADVSHFVFNGFILKANLNHITRYTWRTTISNQRFMRYLTGLIWSDVNISM